MHVRKNFTCILIMYISLNLHFYTFFQFKFMFVYLNFYGLFLHILLSVVEHSKLIVESSQFSQTILENAYIMNPGYGSSIFKLCYYQGIFLLFSRVNEYMPGGVLSQPVGLSPMLLIMLYNLIYWWSFGGNPKMNNNIQMKATNNYFLSWWLCSTFQGQIWIKFTKKTFDNLFIYLASPDRQGHRNGVKPITASPKHRSALGGSLTSNRVNCEELWDGTSSLSSLSENTRKYNQLQMSLQRKHFDFLLSYLKTLSAGPARASTHDLPHSSPALYQLSPAVVDCNSTTYTWRSLYSHVHFYSRS